MLEFVIFNFLRGIVGISGVLNALVVFFAEYLGYFLIAGYFALLFFNHRFQGFKTRAYWLAFLLLSVILSRALFTEIIRFFYYRNRPFVELGFKPLFEHSASTSFPSGHAAFYFVLAFVVVLLHRKWGWAYVLGAVLMGLARVAAGVHWPFDIVAGALVAGLSVFIVHSLLRPQLMQLKTQN